MVTIFRFCAFHSFRLFSLEILECYLATSCGMYGVDNLFRIYLVWKLQVRKNIISYRIKDETTDHKQIECRKRREAVNKIPWRNIFVYCSCCCGIIINKCSDEWAFSNRLLKRNADEMVLAFDRWATVESVYL